MGSSKKKDERTSTMSPLFRVAMHGMFSPSFVKGVTPLKTRKRRMKILSKSRSHRIERGGGEKDYTGNSRGSIIMNTRITWIHHTFVKWQSHPRQKAAGKEEDRNISTQITKEERRRKRMKERKTRSAGIFRNERANRNKHENEPAGEGAEGDIIGEKNSSGAGAPNMKRVHEHRAGGADSTVPRKECHESDNGVNSPRETDDRGGDQKKEMKRYNAKDRKERDEAPRKRRKEKLEKEERPKEQRHRKEKKASKSNKRNGRKGKRRQGKVKLARLFGLNTTCDQKRQCWNRIFKRGTTPLDKEPQRKKGKEKEKQEGKKRRSKGGRCHSTKTKRINGKRAGKQRKEGEQERKKRRSIG